MPPRRQLPWAIKDGGKKTVVKPRAAKRAVQSDIDDDFFDGTVLESSRKGKERANGAEPDEELPGLSSRFAPTTRKGRETSRGDRLPSSSPPPIDADLPPPTTEFMLTGVDKFDLRDDEWMMVEDELLQTAKLFTQHLHLAEYEALKRKMEELRKETAARPVVPNAIPSVEGHFKRKAQEQAKKQKKALREVISTRDNDSEGDEEPRRAVQDRSAPSFPPARPLSTARAPATSKPLQTSGDVSHETASDSDDLDAPKRPPMKKPSPVKRPEVFAKPALPSKTPSKPARGQRRNLWDDWDELTANPKPSIAAPSPSRTPYQVSSPTNPVGLSANQQLSSPTTSFHTAVTQRIDNATPMPTKRRTTTFDDDNANTPKRGHLDKETADRLAKRKADKDREEKTKKKQKYDDIPTFLF
ncbi:hypothetical protein P171DRAFT_471113 [Karstenula rhodostoma CBS 690.94]|uniref:Uncharacterized protein n=1 Tax=Karstenula rhodostoma CBS 690.94 TaxID=1392251 RepID=A0A9P4UEZ3_9PLEO|nr:hypothetical protein P171DRAFT_471113 [Karstenula rhodostoma CBS 690.94]